MSRLLPEMVKLSATTERGATGDHRNHFVLGLPTSTIAEFNKGILFETVAFPLGPAATVVSAQRSGQEERLFGAGYVDTAFTLGAKRWLFSLSYQSMTFASIDDLDLRSGQLAVYVPHAQVTGDVTDRDMMQQLVAFRVNRKTTTFSLGRGWGDRFDMRLVVPLVHMTADARIESNIIRTASPQTDAVHRIRRPRRREADLSRATARLKSRTNCSSATEAARRSASATSGWAARSASCRDRMRSPWPSTRGCRPAMPKN